MMRISNYLCMHNCSYKSIKNWIYGQYV